MLLAVWLVAASPIVTPPAAHPTPVEPLPTIQSVSPTVMRAEAEEATGEMHANLKRILGMVEKARTKRDIVLLNCLNEKLVPMKALVRVAEQSEVNLQEFVAKDQLEGASHERRKIGLAREKVKSLLTEASSCLEESGAYGGKTVVTVEAPEYQGDPTHLDTPEPGQPQTPPSASPYQ